MRRFQAKTQLSYVSQWQHFFHLLRIGLFEIHGLCELFGIFENKSNIILESIYGIKSEEKNYFIQFASKSSVLLKSKDLLIRATKQIRRMIINQPSVGALNHLCYR